MSADLQKAIGIADKVVTLAEDGLRSLDLTIANWPAEFRVIVWEAVADIAARRARIAALKTAQGKSDV
jgi:hypothetical protein